MQAKSDWQEVFKVMKNKDLLSRSLYPAKLPFRMGGQRKCFPDRVKLKEFITTKPLLQEMLKGLQKKNIKTMNIKMAINSQLSTLESKKNKQTSKKETETEKSKLITYLESSDNHNTKYENI